MSELPRMRRFLWGSVKGLAVLGLLVLTMLWLSGAFVDKVEPGPPHPRPKPPSLTTGTVERRAFPLLMEQVGTLRTQNEAHVSSRIMAQVREILVREGDTVMGPEGAAGGATILARLDDRDIQARLHQAQSQQRATERGMEAAKARMEATRAQVEAAKARLDQASSDYRRYEELHKSQAATGQQLEHARAQKDVAEAQARAAMQDVAAAQGEIHRIQAQRTEAEAGVTDANVMLSHTVIHAPITGRLMKKMTDVGEMVSPGRPLFILETPGQPELHAIVSESILPHVRPGQTLETRIDSLDVVLQGVVREIAPKADPATRTALVKVSLPPMPGLVSGLFGRIWVPQGEYHSLVVPRSAVREVGQLTLVDVLDAQGYPQRRFVTLGNRHGEMVEVLSGLQEGEEVVIP